MKQLYKTITEKLTAPEAVAAYRKAGVPACQFIDLYRGQYLNWEAFDAFPVPAVLFEFNISHSSTAEATASITLHLCYEQAQDSSSLSRSKDSALKFFDFMDVTARLLEGLESENTGKLELNSEEMVKDDAIVNVYTLAYTCRYKRKGKASKYKFVEGEKLVAEGQLRIENR